MQIPLANRMASAFLLFQQWINKLLQTLVALIFKTKPIPIPTISYTESLQQYYQKHLKQFLAFSALPFANENLTDGLFYDSEKYKDIHHDHEFTRLFRSRVLMETTPLGNIVMFYDHVKLYFAYYSDQVISSYPILNAVAMKYCRLFRVCHLFVDENILVSPLLSLLKEHYYADNMLPPTQAYQKPFDPEYEIVKQNAHLFKLSKPKSGGNGTNSRIEEKKPPIDEKFRNRFIHLGRIRDFQLLKKPVSTNTTAFMFDDGSSQTADSLFGARSGGQLDWKSFKSRKLGF